MGEVQAKAFAAYSTMIKDDAADGVPVGELSARLFALFAGFSVAN